MRRIIKPPRLAPGDTIGLLAPAYLLKEEHVAGPVETLKQLGFQVKLSPNIFSDTHGYAASVEERAEDFNQMLADSSVKMLLFGGGEVSNEILPYIDYNQLIRHPKIICSYSDSTTLLNAIHYQTGLVTFYGASIRTFAALSGYNRRSFENRLMETQPAYEKSGQWKTICPGKAKGTLAGGYLVNFDWLQGSAYYREIPEAPCLLFIEDHESFSTPAAVSKWFSDMEQRGVFRQVCGLIFGHYSSQDPPDINRILRRIGEKHNIPVVRCEDFGHGENNAILPIGLMAQLNTAAGQFDLLESGVE